MDKHAHVLYPYRYIHMRQAHLRLSSASAAVSSALFAFCVSPRAPRRLVRYVAQGRCRAPASMLALSAELSAWLFSFCCGDSIKPESPIFL